MKYSGIIEFESCYSIEKKKVELEEQAKKMLEYEAAEQQELYQEWLWKNCSDLLFSNHADKEARELRKKLQWKNARNAFTSEQLEKIYEFIDKGMLIGADQYLLFPDYAVEIGSSFAFDIETLARALDKALRFFFLINDTPCEEIFEFAVGDNNQVLCQYRRKKNQITISPSPEQVSKLLCIQNNIDFGFLYDPTLTCLEVADLFSFSTKIPMLFGDRENSILLISEATGTEEREKGLEEKYNLNRRRRELGTVENLKSGIVLSDHLPILRSKYLIAYEAGADLLQMFSYSGPKLEKPSEPPEETKSVERVDKYGKINCVHLFREDMAEDALDNVFAWCEENLENYSILLESRYIGIWCVEWAGYDACSISKQFHCRVMDIEMYDNLTFSVTLIKSGIKVAYTSFGECREVMGADLGEKMFNVELKEHDDIYKGAVELAEQTDCFIIWPDCIPTAKRIRNGDYGAVYICPQAPSV